MYRHLACPICTETHGAFGIRIEREGQVVRSLRNAMGNDIPKFEANSQEEWADKVKIVQRQSDKDTESRELRKLLKELDLQNKIWCKIGLINKFVYEADAVDLLLEGISHLDKYLEQIIDYEVEDCSLVVTLTWKGTFRRVSVKSTPGGDDLTFMKQKFNYKTMSAETPPEAIDPRRSKKRRTAFNS